jgi:hypothetical protein
MPKDFYQNARTLKIVVIEKVVDSRLVKVKYYLSGHTSWYETAYFKEHFILLE